MREIVSPLSGIRSPFGQLTSPLAIYAVLGIKPQLVFDFDAEKYFANSARSAFSDSITHSRAGNATMVDSDGLLKWAPHNLITYSEQFDNAAWAEASSGTGSDPVVTANSTTAPDGSLTADSIEFDLNGGTGSGDQCNILNSITPIAGVEYTLSFWAKVPSGSATFTVIVAGSQSADITVTDEWVLYSASQISAVGVATSFGFRTRGSKGSTDSFTLHAWGAHLYRSDLGGMVDNPDQAAGFETYVPTTSSAVYLPRRGHHVYNGSAWVNEGLLHESEARTNLVAYSNSFGGSGWTKDNFGTALAPAVTATNILSPDGTSNASEIVFDVGAGTTASDASRLIQSPLLTLSAVPHSQSVWMKVPSGTKTVEIGISGSAASAKDVVVTDQWQRFDTQGTPSSNFAFSIIVRGDTTPGSTTLHVYGAQIEQASTPSSYIPTSGATVTRAAETLTVPAANLPWNPLAVSIQMDGRMTYADEDSTANVTMFLWSAGAGGFITTRIDTLSGAPSDGRVDFRQNDGSTNDNVLSSDVYDAGILVPYNIASRHGSTFINGAVDGTALTANTTPVALPDLETTDLNLGHDYMGTIRQFRVWSDDLADEGIEEATLPSLEPSLSLTFDGSESSFTVDDWSA